ncbi:MAG TPA: transposase [Tepidisphaeraceae bacterium]
MQNFFAAPRLVAVGCNLCGRRARRISGCPLTLSPYAVAISVCTRSHLICSTRVHTGLGSDCPDFEPLLFDAWKRHPRLRTVLADAGYDSEANHRIARLDMNVRSIIKTGIGRPGKHGPSGYYRRIMSKRLKGSQRGKPYGQRAQAETVNSMLKRNMGDALRSRSPRARRNEQLLRVLAHNIALLCDEIEG